MIQNPKDVVITENMHDTLSMAEVVYVTDCEIHRCHSQSFIVAGVGTIQAKYSQTMFLEEVDMWTHLELIATVLVE